MRVDLFDRSPVRWEIILPCLSRDARLERALDSVAGEIVSAVVITRVEQGFRLGEADFGDFLKLAAVQASRER